MVLQLATLPMLLATLLLATASRYSVTCYCYSLLWYSLLLLCYWILATATCSSATCYFATATLLLHSVTSWPASVPMILDLAWSAMVSLSGSVYLQRAFAGTSWPASVVMIFGLCWGYHDLVGGLGVIAMGCIVAVGWAMILTCCEVMGSVSRFEDSFLFHQIRPY